MSAKYIRLANLLRSMIKENTSALYKLPTEAALCKKYGVSRTTARKALSVLETEQLIEKRQGSGSYVTNFSGGPEQKTVAVLIASDSEYIYPALLADIRSALQDYGFSMQVYVTDNRISKEREHLEYLLEHPVSGILSEGCRTSLPSVNKDYYEKLQENNTSILFFHGSHSNLQNFPSIIEDDFSGGYYLGKFLISLGHKQIGGIFKTDDMQGLERCYGFLSALRDEHIPFFDDAVCGFDTDLLYKLRERQVPDILSGFADRLKNTCTAIICHNDEIAYWLIKELLNKGMKVPEDISIAGFDNSYLGELSTVRITSLSHKNRELAGLLSENIVKQIKGSLASAPKLSWHLTTRQSTAPPMD